MLKDEKNDEDAIQCDKACKLTNNGPKSCPTYPLIKTKSPGVKVPCAAAMAASNMALPKPIDLMAACPRLIALRVRRNQM